MSNTILAFLIMGTVYMAPHTEENTARRCAWFFVVAAAVTIAIQIYTGA